MDLVNTGINHYIDAEDPNTFPEGISITRNVTSETPLEAIPRSAFAAAGLQTTEASDTRGTAEVFSPRMIDQEDLIDAHRFDVLTSSRSTISEFEITAALAQIFKPEDIRGVRAHKAKEGEEPANSIFTVTIQTTTASLRITQSLKGELNIAGHVAKIDRRFGLPHAYPTTFYVRPSDPSMSINDFISHVVTVGANVILDCNVDNGVADRVHIPDPNNEVILASDIDYIMGNTTRDEHIMVINHIMLVKHLVLATTTEQMQKGGILFTLVPLQQYKVSIDKRGVIMGVPHANRECELFVTGVNPDTPTLISCTSFLFCKIRHDRSHLQDHPFRTTQTPTLILTNRHPTLPTGFSTSSPIAELARQDLMKGASCITRPRVKGIPAAFLFVSFLEMEALARCLYYMDKTVTGHTKPLTITPGKETVDCLEEFTRQKAQTNKEKAAARKEAEANNRPPPSVASTIRSVATKRGVEKALQERVARLRAAEAGPPPPHTHTHIHALLHTPTHPHTHTHLHKQNTKTKPTPTECSPLNDLANLLESLPEVVQPMQSQRKPKRTTPSPKAKGATPSPHATPSSAKRTHRVPKNITEELANAAPGPLSSHNNTPYHHQHPLSTTPGTA